MWRGGLEVSSDNTTLYMLRQLHPTSVILYKYLENHVDFITGTISTLKTEIVVRKALCTEIPSALKRAAGPVDLDIETCKVVIQKSALGATVLDQSWKVRVGVRTFNIVTVKDLPEHRAVSLELKGTDT